MKLTESKLREIIQEEISSLNEAKALDPELAKITLAYLVAKEQSFNVILYLSVFDRENIKYAYGSKLPRGFASNSNSMTSGSLLTVLVGKDVYTDGDDLVKGDSTVLNLKGKETWVDIAKALKL
jgi:hypothetical protein